MAKNAYVGVSGIARRVNQPYVGINGVARKVTDGYIGVSGVARKCYESGPPPVCAMLYTSGNMVFQLGSTPTETLGNSYTDINNFGSTTYNGTNSPWYSQKNTIKNVRFNINLSPTSTANWFANSSNLTNINYTNLNINSITNMSYMCYSCPNLTSMPVCGRNVTNMAGAYRNCPNIPKGNIYIYSKNVTNATGCFGGKNNSRIYNIHVPANSTTWNTFLRNTTQSIVGNKITWTIYDSTWLTVHSVYNAKYGIYIYANTSM